MAALLDIVKKGSVDRSVTIRIIDATAGTPETGVAFDTAGIDLWYRREGAAKTSITEATLAALTTAHTDGGFLHISDGEYRLDLPDAAFATGANHVDIGGTVTGMVVIGGRVRLVNYDPEDTVRLGLTALPNAAADAAGGLPISDAGGLDLDARLDAAVSSRMATYTQPTGFLAATFPSGTIANTTNITAGTITTVTNLTNAPTNGDLTATMKASVNAEVDTALADVRLDELLAADSDIDGAAPPTVGSVFHELMTKTAGSFTYDQTTDSLEALRDRGDAAWITATGFSTHSAADVWAVATRVLTAATNISGPIADQVWDEILSGHAVSGSTGEALSAAGGAGDPWITALPGSYTSGQAGYILGTYLDAAITSRMATYTQPTGFLAATFPTTVASPTNITAGTITTVTNLTNLPAITANWLTAAGIAADAGTEIAAAVWDRVLTGATHNITNSAGKRLREITNSVVHSGTAQAGSTNTITLASSASSTDGTYDPGLVRISGGTGSGQARLILHYTGSTRVAIVDRDWRTAPDNTSEYEILAAPNLMSTNEGLAQGGGASTITLNSSASSVDDTYVGQTVVLRTGTGQDQSRLITDYNGTTKVATVAQSWATQPTSSSAYMVLAFGRAMVADFVDGVIDAAAIAAGALDGKGDWLLSSEYTAPLDAAGVRSAVGLTSANLDTQLTAIDDYLDTEVAAIKAKTDNLPSDPADQSAVEAAIAALLTTQLTESYNADGSAPTISQALFVIMQRLTEFAISGTTITVKKLDGSTTALTLTLDDATTPTSSTRAT